MLPEQRSVMNGPKAGVVRTVMPSTTAAGTMSMRGAGREVVHVAKNDRRTQTRQA